MIPRYPTAKQVMSDPVDFRVKTLEIMHEWKKEHLKGWKEKDIGTKFVVLGFLIEMLGDTYDKPVKGFIASDHYAYDPEEQTILYDVSHPSIISTLHEFGHHLYGRSELKACRWSIWLFKTVFPKTWETLEFRESPYGLLLINKNKAD